MSVIGHTSPVARVANETDVASRSRYAAFDFAHGGDERLRPVLPHAKRVKAFDDGLNRNGESKEKRKRGGKRMRMQDRIHCGGSTREKPVAWRGRVLRATWHEKMGESERQTKLGHEDA
jgi:hypothetical protein